MTQPVASSSADLEVDISTITIKYDRIREDLGNLDDLKNSLEQFGQLQPIIIDDEGNLLDGFRRYTAHKLLGRTHILAIRKADVDEQRSREIELEANILRKDMTWQERAKGIAELDRIKNARNPNWNQALTAQAAGGINQREVSQSIAITRMAEIFPELKEAKTLNQALNMAKAKVEMKVRQKEVRDAPEIYASIEERIILGDSVEVIRGVPDGSFNAIITDPPFGVDYDTRIAGTVGEASAYIDDEAAYQRILSMAPDMFRVLKPHGWLVFFCGISRYEEVKRTFRDAGFTVDEIPIIWKRDQGRTFTNRPDRYFTRGYDIAIHAFRGEPRMAVQGKSNVLDIPPVGQGERDLLVERPVELYAELIRRLTIPGEVVADFFCGSGSCPAAAASLGRGYFAVELSADRRAVAIQKVASYTPEK